MTFLLLYLHKSLRFLLPKCFVITLVILSSQSWNIPGIASFMPMFDLMCVYYWSLYYPALFPAWFAVLLGLLQDILYGMPLGITALSNLILLSIVFSQRKFLIRESFFVKWCIFALFALAILIIKWFIVLIVLHSIGNTMVLLMQWALSCLCYIYIQRLSDSVCSVFERSNRYA